MTQHRAQNVPSDSEITAMAAVLHRRYGVNADSVARHFVAEHEAVGDSARAQLWTKVRAQLIGPPTGTTLS